MHGQLGTTAAMHGANATLIRIMHQVVDNQFGKVALVTQEKHRQQLAGNHLFRSQFRNVIFRLMEDIHLFWRNETSS